MWGRKGLEPSPLLFYKPLLTSNCLRACVHKPPPLLSLCRQWCSGRPHPRPGSQPPCAHPFSALLCCPELLHPHPLLPLPACFHLLLLAANLGLQWGWACLLAPRSAWLVVTRAAESSCFGSFGALAGLALKHACSILFHSPSRTGVMYICVIVMAAAASAAASARDPEGPRADCGSW